MVNEYMGELQRLKCVRNKVLEKERNKKERTKMLKNADEKIRELLFKILTLVIKDEKVPNCSEFYRIDKQPDAEKRLLEIIHKNFQDFKNQPIDGLSKFEILETYIRERRACDEIMEVLSSER